MEQIKSIPAENNGYESWSRHNAHEKVANRKSMKNTRKGKTKSKVCFVCFTGQIYNAKSRNL